MNEKKVACAFADTDILVFTSKLYVFYLSLSHTRIVYFEANRYHPGF